MDMCRVCRVNNVNLKQGRDQVSITTSVLPAAHPQRILLRLIFYSLNIQVHACIPFTVPECNALMAPSNGVVSEQGQTFIDGDVQVVSCNAGFREQGPTEYACVERDASSADWQPVAGNTSCGKVTK